MTITEKNFKMKRKLYKINNEYIGIVFEYVSSFYINESDRPISFGYEQDKCLVIEFNNSSKKYFMLRHCGKSKPEAEEIYQDLINFWQNNT